MTSRWAHVVRAYLPVVALALVVGAVVGAAAYLVSRLDGVALAAVIGAGCTAVAAVAIYWFARSTAVTEVQVIVPQFSKVTFAVTPDRRDLANLIVVELSSSIAIQPLARDEGYPSEAIESLYSVFKSVKGELKKGAGRHALGRPNVDVLALNLINVHLRPFLARWHRRFGDWRAANPNRLESDWPSDDEFRDELAALQHTLRPVAVSFAQLADLADYRDIIGLGPDTAPPPGIV